MVLLPARLILLRTRLILLPGLRLARLRLLLVALVWVVAPIVAVLLAGPDESHRLAFKLQLRDLLTIGVAFILFLVARLLERARTIDEEMREIV